MAKKKKRKKSKKKDTPAVRGQDSPSQPGPTFPTSASLILQQTQWAGPLPAPETLRQYEELLPGLPDRIVGQWERQSEHRQQLERRIVDSNIANERAGLVAGTFVALAGVGLAGYAISIGAELAGFGIFFVELFGLAGVFIHGRRTSDRELERKRRQLDG